MWHFWVEMSVKYLFFLQLFLHILVKLIYFKNDNQKKNVSSQESPCRSQEHLFSLKSVLAILEAMGEDIIFQLYDIRKLFDNESQDRDWADR